MSKSRKKNTRQVRPSMLLPLALIGAVALFAGWLLD